MVKHQRFGKSLSKVELRNVHAYEQPTWST